MLNKPCMPTRVLVVAAVVLCGATAGFAQEADLRKQIEGAVDRLEAAMQRGDAAAIAALYTHDAQLLVPNSNRPATPSGTEDAAVLHRARNGEEVHIAVYRVKPEQQEAFERFVNELLWPASSTVQPEVSERIRFWKAAQAQEDGTRLYAFVFDPYMPTGDYEIERVLAEVHGAEQAARYMQDFARFVEDYTYTPFIQDK